MKMGLKVYYSEISGQKEVKKRQQRVMMILDSKSIPYQPIDITEPGKESDKDFMLKNGKPRGDGKLVLSPQIFHDDLYCGDYDDFDLANENDQLEDFLHCEKVERKVPNANKTNGNAGSRENSADVEKVNDVEVINPPTSEETPAVDSTAAEDKTITTAETGGESGEVVDDNGE